MLKSWFLVFLIVPILELFLFVRVHNYGNDLLGGQLTGILIIVVGSIGTGIVGATLAREQGLGVLRSFRESLGQGDLPGSTLIEGVLILLGAAFLLTPGFLTDAVGLSFLIPAIRKRYVKWGVKRLHARHSFLHVQTFSHPFSQNSGSGSDREKDVIDVPFREVK